MVAHGRCGSQSQRKIMEQDIEQNPAIEQLNSENEPLDGNRQSGIITIVLTADNHLGHTAFSQNPHKREQGRQRLRHAFQQATDFAVGQGVDLFVQAGDLFDTTNPDEEDRSFVAERLAQLRQAGVSDVHNPHVCTACHPGRYFSYRAEKGQTGRMFAVLALTPP